MNVNTHTFSGCVTDAKGDSRGYTFILEQIVAGKVLSYFKVFIPQRTVMAAVETGNARLPEIGDHVVVENALCYEKDGGLQFKVDLLDAIKFYEVNLDLGEVDAGKIF